MLVQYALVQRLVAIADRLYGKVGAAASVGVPAKCRSPSFIQDQCLHRLGQQNRIARGNEQALRSCRDRVWDTPDAGGYDRQSEGHGFEQGHRLALAQRGQDESVESAQPRMDIVLETDDMNDRSETQSGDLGFQSVPLRAVADDIELHVVSLVTQEPYCPKPAQPEPNRVK